MLLHPHNDPSRYFIGYGGVDIFFAISGYIIATGLINSVNKKQKASVVLKSFWTKRVFRILPMAYLWTLIPIVLALTFNSTGGFGQPANVFRDAVANVTQTANFHWQACFHEAVPAGVCGIGSRGETPLAQYWSLSAEEQFYFLFPLLLLFAPRKWLIGLLAAIPLILLFFDRRTDLFVLRFDGIAVGVLLAFAQTKKWYKEYYPRFMEHRAVGLPILVGLVLIIGLVPAWLLVHFTQSIIVVVAGALVFIASFNADLFTRAIPWARPFFLWLGNRSYAVYLIHVPAFILANELYVRLGGPSGGPAKIYLTLIAAVLLFGLVEVCGYFIERPLQRYGRKIAKQIERA